jgi:hypothetical protein
MKEGLFRQGIDDYLGETKGCGEMEQIGRRRAAEGTDGRGLRVQELRLRHVKQGKSAKGGARIPLSLALD